MATSTISGLTRTEFTGLLRVVGDNEVGPQVSWSGVVSFIPSADFFFIQDNDNWNTVQITASVEEDTTYGFGIWEITGDETAPSTANYSIPTGKVYFTDSSNTAGEIDMGNCVNMSITNETTTKDHFRSYGGRRTKDKSIITQTGATIKLTLDEITEKALEIFSLGS